MDLLTTESSTYSDRPFCLDLKNVELSFISYSNADPHMVHMQHMSHQFGWILLNKSYHDLY